MHFRTHPLNWLSNLAAVLLILAIAGCERHQVTFQSLLADTASLDTLAHAPAPPYRQMQASSYNRQSTRRDAPGWFADSDGTGFIREETTQGRREWVAMEYEGPGCITRMWAPFFYYDFNDRQGPTVRIYLDHSPTPAIQANWIELLTATAWPSDYGAAPPPENAFRVPPPLARFTARAGDCYLPIPFARACRITFDRPPFYNIINWRAYPRGTTVETFEPKFLETQRNRLSICTAALEPPVSTKPRPPLTLIPGHAASFTETPTGPGQITSLRITLDPAEIAKSPSLLRSLILRATFDGEETIWCPLGDFFGSPNAINPFTTLTRRVSADGELVCNWVMPYSHQARVTLENLGPLPAHAAIALHAPPAPFDRGAMLFHASWDPDRVLRGDRFEDVNFIDIHGRGVLVGDQWTILNPTQGWWGEGDEKISIDAADDAFPDHFGTGTEDYYGWAGGVVPSPRDVYSHPFLANIAVGSVAGPDAAKTKGATRGFNICARTRTLDAIPFEHRLHFDMEASPGTDQRRASDLLGYSSVVFWYAAPGATSNRTPQPLAAVRPVMSLEAPSDQVTK